MGTKFFGLRNYKLFFWIICLLGFLFGLQQFFPVVSDEASNELVINEFLASNSTGLVDEDGDYSDWLEIYNPRPETINLAGWSLTDDPTQPDKWPFPEMNLAGGEYLVIFVSGTDRTSTA